ncbi:hypothetical protein L6452_37405 [Arctium lappa]|uniref:Uncharacterized protein n=1 Tax=Arctium lappa TaxID=4217 RepID=A0ACB8Y411_ARCLA|nr:hypothetical protein L6452_37405 [Arctium lappa]
MPTEASTEEPQSRKTRRLRKDLASIAEEFKRPIQSQQLFEVQDSARVIVDIAIEAAEPASPTEQRTAPLDPFVEVTTQAPRIEISEGMVWA